MMIIYLRESQIMTQIIGINLIMIIVLYHTKNKVFLPKKDTVRFFERVKNTFILFKTI